MARERTALADFLSTPTGAARGLAWRRHRWIRLRRVRRPPQPRLVSSLLTTRTRPAEHAHRLLAVVPPALCRHAVDTSSAARSGALYTALRVLVILATGKPFFSTPPQARSCRALAAALRRPPDPATSDRRRLTRERTQLGDRVGSHNGVWVLRRGLNDRRRYRCSRSARSRHGDPDCPDRHERLPPFAVRLRSARDATAIDRSDDKTHDSSS